MLISLPGHTRGHACVAVDAGNRWILHCGDAFYEHGVLDGHSRTSKVLRTFELAAAFNRKQVQDNHSRLGELYRRQEPDLLMISAHDAHLYEHAKAAA